jgi:hypothetical protein
MNAYEYSLLSKEEKDKFDNGEEVNRVADTLVNSAAKLSFLNDPHTKEVISKLEFISRNIHMRVLRFVSSTPSKLNEYEASLVEEATINKVLNLIRNGKYDLES